MRGLKCSLSVLMMVPTSVIQERERKKVRGRDAERKGWVKI